MENQEPFEPITYEVTPNKRPIAITIMCVFGFLGVALSLPGALMDIDTVNQLGYFYPFGTNVSTFTWHSYFRGVSTLVALVCIIGFMEMKKWAVYLYIVYFVINQIVLLYIGIWDYFSLVVPGITLGITLVYFKRMG